MFAVQQIQYRFVADLWCTAPNAIVTRWTERGISRMSTMHIIHIDFKNVRDYIQLTMGRTHDSAHASHTERNKIEKKSFSYSVGRGPKMAYFIAFNQCRATTYNKYWIIY